VDYYELYSDEADEHQWWLDTPETRTGDKPSVWAFTQGLRYGGESPLLVPIAEDGVPRDLVFGAFDVPYASPKAASIFQQSAPKDLQCIPATASDGTPIFVVNVLAVIDCLDQHASALTYAGERINMVLASASTWCSISELIRRRWAITRYCE
jgi:hypothetical protein